MTVRVDNCRMGNHRRGEACACFGSGKVWRREDGGAAAPALKSDELGTESDLDGVELWDRVTNQHGAIR